MSVAPASPSVTPRHYQAICGLALAGVMMLQVQQSTMALHISLGVTVLIGFIGVRALLYRSHISPMLVLITLALPYLFEQYYTNQGFTAPAQSGRVFDVADVLLCVAALTYFIGHYRLNCLWFGVLPDAARGGASAASGPPRVRSLESLSAGELVGLVFTVPALALLAQFVFLFLTMRWRLIDMSPGTRQLAAVTWALFLGVFLAAHAFRYWRRLGMDGVSARLMLQDLLWQETRGEQRRISRWLAWSRLRRRK